MNMAVDSDYCDFQTTDSLVDPAPRTFYPAHIPVPHQQLRSLVSSPAPDTLYYASDCDLIRLQLSSRRRELVTTLPFSPQCLVAGYGWLCAGGVEHAQFAAVKVDDGSTLHDRQLGPQHGVVDHTLSRQNQSEHPRPVPLFYPLADDRAAPSRRSKPDVYIKNFGGLTMNSITLFQPPAGTEDAEFGPIAVLSNNDKTVRLYSPSHKRIFTTLEFPFAINHASIRADGKLLVAVGDDAYAYFYQRLPNKGPSTHKAGNGRTPSASTWEWELLRINDLERAPHVGDDAWFATAFSPSGQYCAVASQGGVITVFDTQLVGKSDSEAIIAVTTSSRPHELSRDGAIRSICFAPPPWDLLICVEHSERVCVIDTRSGFRTRQTVKLDPLSVERAEIVDCNPTEDVIDPRLRTTAADWDSLRLYRDVTAPAADDIPEPSADRRRLQRQPHETFSAHERQILEALRTSRNRIEAREQSLLHSADLLARESPNSLRMLYSDGRPSATGAHNDPAVASSTLLPAVRNHFRERVADGENSRPRPYDPRRRSSFVLTQGSLDSLAATVHDLHETARTLSPLRMQGAGASDPWRAIEAVLDSSSFSVDDADTQRQGGASDPAPALTPYALAIRELERLNARRLTALGRRRLRIRSMQAAEDIPNQYEADSPRGEEAENPLGTTGCCMSQDGRKLYVGTEGGIFELTINISNRKCFPCISLR